MPPLDRPTRPAGAGALARRVFAGQYFNQSIGEILYFDRGTHYAVNWHGMHWLEWYATVCRPDLARAITTALKWCDEYQRANDYDFTELRGRTLSHEDHVFQPSEQTDPRFPYGKPCFLPVEPGPLPYSRCPIKNMEGGSYRLNTTYQGKRAKYPKRFARRDPDAARYITIGTAQHIRRRGELRIMAEMRLAKMTHEAQEKALAPDAPPEFSRQDCWEMLADLAIWLDSIISGESDENPRDLVQRFPHAPHTQDRLSAFVAEKDDPDEVKQQARDDSNQALVLLSMTRERYRQACAAFDARTPQPVKATKNPVRYFKTMAAALALGRVAPHDMPRAFPCLPFVLDCLTLKFQQRLRDLPRGQEHRAARRLCRAWLRAVADFPARIRLAMAAREWWTEFALPLDLAAYAGLTRPQSPPVDLPDLPAAPRAKAPAA